MKIAKILVALTLLFGVAAVEAEAAKKKASSSPAPSAAQRKKMHADGLIGCRKKFGTQLHFVRVEKFYGRWAAVCYHY
jgi:hypothetical protein